MSAGSSVLPASFPIVRTTVRRDRWSSAALKAAWIAIVALAALFATVPLAVDAQLTLAGAIVGAILVLTRFRQTRLGRLGIMALGALVTARYLSWRLTSTLPDLSDPVSFGLGIVLLLAELYCAVILAVSFVVNADPLRRVAPSAQTSDEVPTVDVFIPSYNEDETILAMTVAAAKAMDYPADKLTVWLLDDGGTDQKCADPDPEKSAAARLRRQSLQRLCDELGAVYSTRARNEHAKAGNLNSGLAKSRGEIVVVFDADHAPFRSFLRETVGCFAADPKLFLVQTPHIFLNPDPIEKNLRTFHMMPSENEMFYGDTQRGLDKWNASFFCGSAALLRRTALEETNGFSGITITEDCETAFELHARGWTSAYIDKPLIAGLQPETFADFIVQRSRWCQGMVQILMLKNPALRPGLSVIQRVSYLSSMTFWFFPLPRLVFMLAPLLHIFFDVKIFVSSVDETIAYTATYMLASVIIQNALYGRLRWPWMSELYEYVQGMFLCGAIVSVMLSPKKPTFKVTNKGTSLDHDHLSALAWPFVLVFLALAGGVATATYRYLYEPGVTSLMIVVGLWAAMNLVLAGVALGAVAERKQPDRHPRLAIDRAVRVRHDGATLPARAVNVSASGCVVRIACDEALDLVPGATLDLLVDDDRCVSLTIVRVDASQTRTVEVAAAFVVGSPRDYRPIAELMYGDPGAITRFIAARRNHKGILAGSFAILRWSVIGPVQALRFHLSARNGLPSALGPMPVAILAPVSAPVTIAVDRTVAAPPSVAPAIRVAPRIVVAEVRHDIRPRAEPAAPQAEFGPVQGASEAVSDPTAGTGPATAEWLAQLVLLAEGEIRAARGDGGFGRGTFYGTAASAEPGPSDPVSSHARASDTERQAA